MSKIEVDAIDKQSGSTLTLGGSGTAVTLACGATQSGFGRNGSVNWQTTIKTGDFTATSGEGYFVNTTSGAITLTLPSSPSVGDIVAFKDYAGTFQTNNLTIGRNGSNIIGGTTDPVISVEGQAGTLVYGDATQGWQIVEAATDADLPRPSFISATGGTISTQCTNFKVHTFTSPGTFQVTDAGNSSGSNTLEYLVVAGGGGSARDNAAGAGAGGTRFYSSCLPSPSPATPRNAPAGITASVSSYPITVGGGGAAGPCGGPPGARGSDSSFSTITSTGGGTSTGDGQPGSPLQPGGSGGGRGQGSPGPVGSGNTPPVSPSQGENGGGDGGNPGGGGGGGGFLNAGSCRSGNTGGAGGDGGGFAGTYFGANGVPCGSFRYYAGGGGGGNGQPGGSPGGAGGKGGGGAGSTSSPGSKVNGVAGTTNTGGGGGGGGQAGEGAAGGSGIVIIRYKFQ
jgi:hypothetical protein